MKRIYFDANDRQRVAEYIGMVPYMTPNGICERWMIDGAILQIPVSAWALVRYVDLDEKTGRERSSSTGNLFQSLNSYRRGLANQLRSWLRRSRRHLKDRSDAGPSA
jgi:hypothetical protein